MNKPPSIVEFNNVFALKENGFRQGMKPEDWKTLITDPWKNSVGMDWRGYAIFADSEDHTAQEAVSRAFARVLFRHWERFQNPDYCNERDLFHKILKKQPPGLTLARLAREYAPTSETTHKNNPERYGDDLQRITRISRDQILQLFWSDGSFHWPITVEDIAFAIARIETGIPDVIRRKELIGGFRWYLTDFVVRKKPDAA